MDKDNLPSADNSQDATDQALMGSLADQPMREPLATAHSHHHSRMFQVNLLVNPLIAAAAPLFSLTTQLAQSQQTPNFKLLLRSLIDEVKSFEVKANEQHYRAQIILAARYLLCSLIDETILSTTWGKTSRWNQHNLLSHFQKETWGGKRFFLILERASEEPKIYIDLLEFGYLCLSLGFQGQYALSHDYHNLSLFIDRLYEIIRRQRGESSRRLLVSAEKPKKKKTSRWLLPPLWFTGLITLIILAGIFVLYYFNLERMTKPINQTIKNMQTSTAKNQSEL